MNNFTNKPGFGGLFQNNYKEPGDNKPDRKGSFAAHRDIKAGEEIEIAAWEKQDHNGKPFLSLKVSDKQYYPDESTLAEDADREMGIDQSYKDGGTPPGDLDDEIPF